MELIFLFENYQNIIKYHLLFLVLQNKWSYIMWINVFVMQQVLLTYMYTLSMFLPQSSLHYRFYCIGCLHFYLICKTLCFERQNESTSVAIHKKISSQRILWLQLHLFAGHCVLSSAASITFWIFMKFYGDIL